MKDLCVCYLLGKPMADFASKSVKQQTLSQKHCNFAVDILVTCISINVKFSILSKNLERF